MTEDRIEEWDAEAWIAECAAAELALLEKHLAFARRYPEPDPED